MHIGIDSHGRNKSGAEAWAAAWPWPGVQKPLRPSTAARLLSQNSVMCLWPFYMPLDSPWTWQCFDPRNISTVRMHFDMQVAATHNHTNTLRPRGRVTALIMKPSESSRMCFKFTPFTVDSTLRTSFVFDFRFVRVLVFRFRFGSSNLLN